MSSQDSSARSSSDHDSAEPVRDSSDVATIIATPSKRARVSKLHPPSLRLGRYVVVDTIGAGGVGVVYAAYDPELDRKIAIKLLHGHHPSARARARLQREAQAMARLNHANVVAVHDVGTFADQVFLALEYVEGTTLREWMELPRTWAEIVKLFLAAGEGLRAAHEAGLVHRDFKPENVLVTPSGQPKVTDFGLVRAIGEDDDEPRPDESVADAELLALASATTLSTPLTREGAVLGTPAYMAPEQLRGGEADARADQYSFCVTLHEALWGHRPFPGIDERGLEAQLRANARIPRLGRREIPSWLAAVVDRGLALDPAARWPSMAALLAALADDPAQRRRRRRRIGLAAAGFALLIAGLVTKERFEAAACERAGQAIERTWDPRAANQIEEAMLDTKVSYAPDTWARTQAALDRWAASWHDERVEICASDSPDPRQVRCLEAQLDVLAGVLGVLAETDRLTLGHALETVAALPGPELCADPAWLSASNASLFDPARTNNLYRRLARARALGLAGRHEDARATAQAVLDVLESEGRSPIQLEARLVLAEATMGLADYAEARAVLEQVQLDARAIGDERLALDAAFALIDVLGALAEPALASLWAKQAEASIEHLDSHASERVKLHRRRATLYSQAADYAAAETELRAALELVQTEEGALGGEGDILQQLGVVVSQLGRHDEARALLERGRERRVELLGSEHPDLAESDMALAENDLNHGNYEPALARCERALELRERAFGREHPDTVEALHNIALLDYKLGRLDEALAIQREVSSLREQIFGADHPSVGRALINLSFMLHSHGRYDEAQAALERAVAVLEASLGADHPSVAKAVNNLAVLQEGQGQLDAALANYERALAVFRESFGPEHEKVARATLNRGGVLVQLGREREGLDAMAEGLASLGQSLGADHPTTAEFITRLGLAEVEAGEREAGLAHLLRALEIRTTKVGVDDPLRAELLRSIARVELEAGDIEAALDAASQAYELVERELVGAADVRAGIRFILARALVAGGGDRRRAKELVDAALAELRDAEDSENSRALLAEIERWRPRATRAPAARGAARD